MMSVHRSERRIFASSWLRDTTAIPFAPQAPKCHPRRTSLSARAVSDTEHFRGVDGDISGNSAPSGITGTPLKDALLDCAFWSDWAPSRRATAARRFGGEGDEELANV
ncbi:hypothetical protein FA15DRAFT_120033 [Coprinopsis marcescibilis]|uniref:Uncharacterized protein n=1 Tax=Coprinopsis marcescibilis TaxID=230819 RepID=A0A5C3L5H5_COPMA|nr:hypothetical protein FA15DRAFT_120033 [Coprinopsis marcescibilis]